MAEDRQVYQWVDGSLISRLNIELEKLWGRFRDLVADAATHLVNSNNLSDVSDAATSRTNLGLGTLAVENDPLALAKGGTGAATAAAARTNLGLGTLAVENDPLALAKGGTGAATAAAARTNLGLGTLAVENDPLALAKGGTGAATAAAARTNLGLGDLAVENSPLAIAKGGTAAITAAAARTSLGLVAGGAGDVWVEKAGDTMTGDLVVSSIEPTIQLSETDVPQVWNIESRAGTIRFENGNATSVWPFRMVNTAVNEILRLAASAAVVNEDGSSAISFRVEGGADTVLLNTDPVNSRVGIGTGSPAEKLEVNGNVKASGFLVGTLEAPVFAVGNVTALPFYQASAPTGWTRIVTGFDGCVVRLSTAGSPGTATTASRQSVENLNTDSYTLTVADMPAHTHSPLTAGGLFAIYPSTAPVQLASGLTYSRASVSDATTGSTGGGGGHLHGVSVKYAEMMVCSMD